MMVNPDLSGFPIPVAILSALRCHWLRRHIYVELNGRSSLLFSFELLQYRSASVPLSRVFAACLCPCSKPTLPSAPLRSVPFRFVPPSTAAKIASNIRRLPLPLPYPPWATIFLTRSRLPSFSPFSFSVLPGSMRWQSPGP